MKLLSTLLATLCAAIVLIAGASAFQDGGQGSPTPGSPAPGSPTLDSARARWERLSPEEQARMKERYERYRALSEDERRGLAVRARRMREEKERVQAELPHDVRERIQRLDPTKRREVIRDIFEGEAREKGARIRSKMPESWIRRLENARPEDRARFLAEFQRKSRERVAQAAIDKIGKKLGLAKEEIERLKALSEVERAKSVLALRQQLTAQDAAEFGLPDGITREQWDAWQRLPPEQFFEAMQRYRIERQMNQVRPAPNEPRLTPERLRFLREVEDALRSRREEFVDLADLPPEARRERLFERRRERVVRVLRASGEYPADELAEIEKLPEPLFLRAIRNVLPPPSRGPWSHHRGGDGHGGGAPGNGARGPGRD